MTELICLAFTSSAFNEEADLEDLNRRCRVVHEVLRDEFSSKHELDFCLLMADNGSEDAS
jgi:hypothetical protein